MFTHWHIPRGTFVWSWFGRGSVVKNTSNNKIASDFKWFNGTYLAAFALRNFKLLERDTMSITLTAIHSVIGMCTTLTYVALRQQIFWKTLKMMKIN